MQTRIVSWNINSDRRVEKFSKPDNMSEAAYKDYVCTANAFPDFAVAERFPMIAVELNYFRNNKKVAIFALQEVENSILPTLIAHLKSIGMEVIVDKYNPSDMAFNFVFAYDPKLYQVKEEKLFYLTKTGEPPKTTGTNEEILAYNLGSLYGRSFQKITLKNLVTNEEFVLANAHLDMSNNHKILATQSMCNYLLDVKVPCLIVGDMNQGDFDVNEPKLFEKQVKTFQDNGYHWDGESLYTNKPNCTFVTLPYDTKRFWNKDVDGTAYEKVKQSGDFKAAREFFVNKIIEKKIPLCTTTLDGVYSKNNKANDQKIKPTSCKAILFMSGKRVKPMPSAEEINQLASDSFKNQQCQFPSDHLPVLVKSRM